MHCPYNPATRSVSYGNLSVGAMCDEVAADSACQGLSACSGRCYSVMGPPDGGWPESTYHGFSLPTIIILTIVATAALLVLCCCCAGECLMRRHEGKDGAARVAPEGPRGRGRGGRAVSPPTSPDGQPVSDGRAFMY